MEEINLSNGTPILCCECRTEGCWDLTTRIIEREDKVIWKHFLQPHRRKQWDYKTFGEFSFDKIAYWEEVKKLLYPYSESAANLPRRSDISFELLCKDFPENDKPDWFSIKHAVYELARTYQGYAVLKPSSPIDDSIYLQAAYQDDFGYAVETRIVTGDSFIHYQLQVTDVYEVLKIFKAYFDYQYLPDLTTWKDYTQELLAYELSKQKRTVKISRKNRKRSV